MNNDLNTYLAQITQAKQQIIKLNGMAKKALLLDMAKALIDHKQQILQANAKDVANAHSNSLKSALIDRLVLNDERLEAMAQSIHTIAGLREPIGRVLDGWRLDNGLQIEKVSVPIGVVGVIFESRPNVVSDISALCLRSSNIAILKGGKEATHSNKAIMHILQQVLQDHHLPTHALSLFIDSSRKGVEQMINLPQYIDLIIPRGGEELIAFVAKNSQIPVIKHDKGVCHLYIDEYALSDKAIDIAINAKVQRPGVCNAIETLLIHRGVAGDLLPKLKAVFATHHTELKGCDKTRQYIDISPCSEEEYHIEYLANILNIKVVDSVQEAIEHINHYGSGHSEAIISEHYGNSEQFCHEVDAACVYVNASTRFTDGGAFGFGAEVGISTNKLHARGPMGLDELTTYKYKVLGSGQIRS